MSQQDKFNRIVASLHDAMLDDSRWRAASALIDDACGSTGSELVIVGGSSQREATQRKESATFDELLRRGGATGGLNIRMDGPDGLHVVWVLENPTSPDGWNSEQIAMIERLLPHVRQFVRVRHALAGAGALGTSVAGLLDGMLVGAICLDWRGIIVRSNTRADALLRSRDALLNRDGFLRARVPSDDRQLRTLLGRAVPRSGLPGAGGSMTVARLAGPRLALHVTPADAGAAGLGIGHGAALVLIGDPAAKATVDPNHVAATLGLTPAESRIAAALADGLTIRDIAAATQRAPSTIRELLKRIHAKLGISRRADLVRMVLSLSPFANFDQVDGCEAAQEEGTGRRTERR